MIKAYPNLARRVVEEGHEVGNHSYDHPALTKLSPEGVRAQLSRTNEQLRLINGDRPVATMRPPFGARNRMTDEICQEMGMKVILWDVDTNDWRKRTAAQITETVLRSVQPGSIVLFHDRLQGSLDAQGPIIDGLRARGYRFVTISQLLALREQPSTLHRPSTDSSRVPATRANPD
jgi:peptidoglycan/xylan/chitin deacetylase (PgdA/CDA1 family)